MKMEGGRELAQLATNTKFNVHSEFQPNKMMVKASSERCRLERNNGLLHSETSCVFVLPGKSCWAIFANMYCGAVLAVSGDLGKSGRRTCPNANTKFKCPFGFSAKQNDGQSI